MLRQGLGGAWLNTVACWSKGVGQVSWKARLAVIGFFVFTALPIIEIALLVEVGKRIGTLWTIALVLGTGLLGGVLLGVEGVGVLKRLKAEVAAGKVPEDQIIDGVLIVVGSLLLITPGVLTDATGILLMFPPTRFLVRAGIKRWIRKYVLVNL